MANEVNFKSVFNQIIGVNVAEDDKKSIDAIKIARNFASFMGGAFFSSDDKKLRTAGIMCAVVPYIFSLEKDESGEYSFDMNVLIAVMCWVAVGYYVGKKTPLLSYFEKGAVKQIAEI